MQTEILKDLPAILINSDLMETTREGIFFSVLHMPSLSLSSLPPLIRNTVFPEGVPSFILWMEGLWELMCMSGHTSALS